MLFSKKRQIFLLHFAGGNCYSYDFLKEYFHKDTEYIALELPGRGKRHDSSLLKDREQAISDFTTQIRARRSSDPYIIYGHSMGASLGLEITKKMESYNDAPKHLIVSGNPGPGADEVDSDLAEKNRYLMNDEDFKKELIRLGGIPNEVLENEELYNYFSPIMRADFEIVERKVPKSEPTIIQTPIYALMGTEEETSNKINNWANHTTSMFNSKILQGNHFFLYDHPKELMEVIMSCFELQMA